MLVLVILASTVALAEVAARCERLLGILPAPSYGSRSMTLEVKIENLRRFSALHRGVDCVFLGNSMALFGFDPDAFAAAVRARGAEDFACFNFAVPGMTAVDAAVLARVLAAAFEPSMLLYGLSVRDLSQAASGPHLSAMTWTRHHLGFPSIEGWLVDRSHAYRIYRGWRASSQRSYPPRYLSEIRADGYVPSAPRSFTERRERAKANRTLRPYIAQGIAEGQVGALANLGSLRALYESIVFVELPVHRGAGEWFASAGDYYAEAIASIEDAAAKSEVPFLRAFPSPPGADWNDWWHLNRRGAAAFSRWLGDHVPLPERVTSGEHR